MPVFRRTILWMGALLACAGAAAAESPFDLARPALRTQGTLEGLTSANVYDLTLDAKGRLWTATISGAAYQTGGSWTPFPLPATASSSHLRAILEGADGSLWLGTQSGGLWQHREGQWIHHSSENGFPCDRVNTLLEMPDGAGGQVLWVGTRSAGVACYQGGRWILLGAKAGLPDPMVWKLRAIREPDGTRRVWAATARGLARWTGSRWEVMTIPGSHRDAHVNDLLEVEEADGRRTVWASCWNLGLARWNGRAWTILGPAQGFPSRNPTCLALTRGPDGKAVLWAGTYEAGLLWSEGAGWKRLGPDEGFPSTGVHALLPNPRGRPSLWVGTRSAGVVSLDLGAWRTLDQRHGLPSSEVTCFAEESRPQGPVFWIGTRRGLVRWEGGRIHPEPSFPASIVFKILPTRSPGGAPQLWVGTLNGLMLKEGGRWKHFGPAEGFPVGMSTSVAEVVEPDGSRAIWAGLDHGHAVLRQGRWEITAPKEGFPADSYGPSFVTHDPDGRSSFWVGTRSAGVLRIRGDRTDHYGTAQGLPSLAVNCFLETHTQDGRAWLWAGLPIGGLARLEKDRPGATWLMLHPGSEFGLPTHYTQSLRADREGRIYAGTTSGIYRITLGHSEGAPVPARIERFTTSDGLPTLNSSAGASCLDSEGRVWLGTSQGAVVLDPLQEPRPTPPPLPLFERVGLAGRPTPLKPGESLGHRENHLFFEVALPVFHRREDAQYRTQLLGLEPEPGPWTSEERRELAAIPGGRYTMRLWARDYTGHVAGPVDFPFQVAPSPWTSPWAWLLYLGTTLGLWYLALSVRLRLFRRRAAQLEAQVKVRTQELEAANLQLTDALQEVRTLRGLIPICSCCKKIRDDRGLWNQLESYISAHSEATFSHGICPECRPTLYAQRPPSSGSPAKD